MAYRLYTIDPVTTHIEKVEELDVASDREALAIASSRLNGRPLELWEGTRKVMRLETPERQWLARMRDKRAALRSGTQAAA